MKLTVTLILLAAICQAAEVKESPRSKQNVEEGATNKRALEGNSVVGKRAPLLSTVAPSITPGIEYAASKELLIDKSPAQQIYATPVPQIAKISDVLTGSPPFQAAIASHLYAPISVYQPRVSSFEISPPVQAQLAYSENLSYQQPNAVQYAPQVFKPPQKQDIARLTLQQPQQILVQPVYQQQAHLNPQQIYQQTPQAYQGQLAYNQNQFQLPYPQGFQVAYPQNQFSYPQNHVAYAQNQIAYPQNQVTYAQNQVAYPQNQVTYAQNQVAYPQNQVTYAQKQVTYPQNQVTYPQNQAVYAQKLVQVPSVQSGIVYAKQEAQRVQNPPPQRELKTVQPIVVKHLEKQATTEQNYKNTHSQGAVSYASFSQSQPLPSFEQSRKQTQYQPQAQTYQTQPQPSLPQTHVQYHSESQNQPRPQSQPQTQAQPQYQVQAQPQYQIQTQPQYQVQPQLQYQIQSQPQIQIQPQPQYVSAKLEPSSANSISAPITLPSLNAGRAAYYRPSPFQPQIFQPQLYSGQDVLLQNPGFGAVGGSPAFPPVQYFGKFAQSIFGEYQN